MRRKIRKKREFERTREKIKGTEVAGTRLLLL